MSDFKSTFKFISSLVRKFQNLKSKFKSLTRLTIIEELFDKAIRVNANNCD